MNRNGFTLLELTLAIAVLALGTGAALATFSALRQQAALYATQKDAAALAMVADRFHKQYNGRANVEAVAVSNVKLQALVPGAAVNNFSGTFGFVNQFGSPTWISSADGRIITVRATTPMSLPLIGPIGGSADYKLVQGKGLAASPYMAKRQIYLKYSGS